MEGFAMTTSFKSDAVARLHSQAGSIERKLDHLKNDVGVEVDEKACAYQQQHPDVSYSAALEAVFAEYPNLAKAYEESFITRKTGHVEQHTDEGDADTDDSPSTAGKEIDRMALKMQRENPGWSYERCLQRILEENPELKKKYAGIR
jgi:hypothetical protein